MQLSIRRIGLSDDTDARPSARDGRAMDGGSPGGPWIKRPFDLLVVYQRSGSNLGPPSIVEDDRSNGD